LILKIESNSLNILTDEFGRIKNIDKKLIKIIDSDSHDNIYYDFKIL